MIIHANEWCFPESFCVNIYFPSKASLLNECHSDCSLSKKKGERKGKQQQKFVYMKYICSYILKFFWNMKEKLERQELTDSWKWNTTWSLYANLMTPYTGKAKSYQTILFLYEISSRSTSSCSTYFCCKKSSTNN